MSDDRYAGLPKAEFAFPGPLRDQLVAAILSGEKTSTTGLMAEYRALGDYRRPPAAGRWWWTRTTFRWR